MDDDKKTRMQDLEKLQQKRDAVMSEIDMLLVELEVKRKAEFAKLDSGSDITDYNRLLARILRWLRIAAALRCGQKPPEPIASMMTEEERNLFERAVGIVKSIQKLRSSD